VSGPEMGPLSDGKPTAARLAKWVDSVGVATLPVLAGFSTASVIVVSDDAANFRWSGLAILALAIAAVVLIAAIQCAYHARIYLSEWPDRKDRKENGPDNVGTQDGSQEPDHDYELGLARTKWTQRAYHSGSLHC
jgi:hypothetical protein